MAPAHRLFIRCPNVAPFLKTRDKMLQLSLKNINFICDVYDGGNDSKSNIN